MALDIKKILKGLRILNDSDSTKALELNVSGSTNTKTTVTTSQTANRTVTLPDATDTLVGRATSDTLTNKSIDADTNTITNIENADIKAAAAIDATKIADGTVDNTEFQYLNGVTSAIQTQLGSKENSSNKGIANGYASLDASGLVPTTQMPPAALERLVVVADQTARFALTTATVQNGDTVYQNDTTTMYFVKDDTNLGNSSGYTIYSAGTSVNFSGSLSGDISGTQGATAYNGVVPVAKGGTNSSTALTNGKVMVSTAGAVVESAVTSTSLGYLDATSSVQTQLDGKIAKSLVTTTGDMIYASGASTPARLPVGSSGQVIKSVGGIPTWATFSGGINYLSSNPDAEADTTGWATYADAAASSPVDGTGGSPSSTYTRSTSSPLRGSASFLWTKSAANRQGEGFSYDFTIDSTDQAKVLQIAFDYKVASGTYADSDMTIWIYDVTNAVLIQPAGYTIQNASVSMKQLATFQSASNSTSYRLIVHTASTSASAYTIQFDNFSVGPQVVTNGAAITDWQSYTPSSQGFGTPTFDQCLWRQIGDSIEIQVQFTCGTTTATQARIGLPNGMTTNYSTTHVVGNAVRSNSTTTAVKFFTILSGSNIDYILFSIPDYTGGNNALTAANGNGFSTSGDIISLIAKVRINGKSSNVQLSSDTDTRVVAMRVQAATPTGSTSAASAVVYGTAAVFDTHAGYNTSTGQYTVPVSGYYQVYGQVSLAGTEAANQFIDLSVYKNTTVQQTMRNRLQNSGTDDNECAVNALVLANAGDTLEIRVNTNITGVSFNTNANINFFQVQRVSGPSVIAASEGVMARYTGNDSASLSATPVVIKGFTKDYDTHGMINSATGAITIPVSGIYEFTVQASCNALTTAMNQYFNFELRTGSTANAGTVKGNVYQRAAYSSSGMYCNMIPFTIPLRCLAGDVYSFQAISDVGASRALQNEGFVAVKRIGNY